MVNTSRRDFFTVSGLILSFRLFTYLSCTLAPRRRNMFPRGRTKHPHRRHVQPGSPKK